MKKLQEIFDEQAQKISALQKQYNLFWAFSDQQFSEGAAANPLEEGDKYCRIFAGGFMPKSKRAAFMNELDKQMKAFYKEIEDAGLKDEHILYELNNLECFYTQDIEPALLALRYPKEDIVRVFNANLYR